MRCKQDMIDNGERLVPRTCPVHGLKPCRPIVLEAVPGKRVYLAGPMRGKPHFNREAFARYAAKLRAAGHEVFSPAEATERRYGPRIYLDNEHGDEPKAGIDGRAVFEEDLVWICRYADAVAMMPGWENSRGARAEHGAAVALDLEIIYL